MRGALHIENMVHHPRRAPHEDGSPKFWLLFFLGLAIVLILFRAFGAAVEGASRGFDGGKKGRKRRRSDENEAGRARKDARRRDLDHRHVE